MNPCLRYALLEPTQEMPMTTQSEEREGGW